MNNENTIQNGKKVETLKSQITARFVTMNKTPNVLLAIKQEQIIKGFKRGKKTYALCSNL